MQKKITEQFGVVAHKVVIPTDVWSLKVSDPEKLKAIVSKKSKPSIEYKFADGINTTMIEDKTADEIVDWLEGIALQKPVVNRTGLAGRYDLNLSWDIHDPTNRIPNVVNQLRRAGLELMLNQEKMEMLVVERVK